MRVEPPTLTVEQSIEGLWDRQSLLLSKTAGADLTEEQIRDTTADLYSNRAIANLILDRHVDAANDRLVRTAEWFDHPHPNGREHTGECDFAAMKLSRVSHLFADDDRLYERTRDRIRRFFLTTDFQSRHHSENHDFLFYTCRYLMGRRMPDDTFEAYAKTGRELATEDGEWLVDFIRYRARRAWGEFDSACYVLPDWECLVSLYDFCGATPSETEHDRALPDLVRQMMNVLLLDTVVDSVQGIFGGAHGRIYEPHAHDHARGNTYPLQYLYFGDVDPDTVPGGTLVDALSSDFVPDEIVVDIALNRTLPYHNRESNHLHNCSDVRPVHPVEGSIQKLTLVDEDFILGTIQTQDDYPEDCDGAWYARHEQHEWDLSFTGSTTARLFTHHPGEAAPEHGYWTGDIRCCCGSFFQHETAVLALYDIPESQPLHFIHAWIPKDCFDEIVEENGWTLVRICNGYGAIRLLGEETEWVEEGDYAGSELISRGTRNAAVCEAGSRSRNGSFESFRAEITENNITFDASALSVTYVSSKAGTLYLDNAGTRQVDGQDVDLDYALYDCPYLSSEWDSGTITATIGDRSETYRF